MFRLLIALGVAVVLLPAETITGNKEIEATKVTTYDAFSAAQSLYSDVSSFCDRNQETCVTGKAIAVSAVHKIRGGIQNFTQDSNKTVPEAEIDLVKTASTTN